MLLIGLAIIGSTSYYILHRHAREEVIKQATVLMEAALAMRKYTITEIKPLLALQNKRNFLPQSVPSYAATKNFDALREKHSEYSYKEATLNPTNPRDRAADWEADIIQEFRNNLDREDITLVRDTALGTMLYYARPIRIKNQGCLTCHGIIEDAPEKMLELYGPANGFGWKMDEVVGSQIVSVPLWLPVKRANETFFVLMACAGGVFLVLYLVFILIFKKLLLSQATSSKTAVDYASQGNNTYNGSGIARPTGNIAQGRKIVHDSAVPQRFGVRESVEAEPDFEVPGSAEVTAELKVKKEYESAPRPDVTEFLEMPREVKARQGIEKVKVSGFAQHEVKPQQSNTAPAFDVSRDTDATEMLSVPQSSDDDENYDTPEFDVARASDYTQVLDITESQGEPHFAETSDPDSTGDLEIAPQKEYTQSLKFDQSMEFHPEREERPPYKRKDPNEAPDYLFDLDHTESEITEEHKHILEEMYKKAASPIDEADIEDVVTDLSTYSSKDLDKS